MSTLKTTNIANPSSASNNIVLDSSGRTMLGVSAQTVSKLFVSGGSLSVSGGDADFASGGNRVLIDHDSTNVRFGATGGGTSWTRGISFLTSNSSTTNTEVFRIASAGSFTAVVPSGGTLYPAFWCRAWVNFDGTGTVAIRNNGNVSSITDNGTGDYTINFGTAMPDANYSTVFGCALSFNQTNGDQGWANLRSNNGGTDPQQTSSVRIWTSSKTSALGSPVDPMTVNVAIFR